MRFHIVLVHPEIPQNAGGIGRLCVSTETSLHLIRPLGFSLDDKYVKRAGMDYWRCVDLHVYENWEEFLAVHPAEECCFLTTKSTRSYRTADYRRSPYLVFGSESSGLPPEFYVRYERRLFTIPMRGRFHRSLNLANSAAIALYEALRTEEGEPPVPTD